jgi:hypothetical protein
MRKAILGAASALALASPAVAAELSVPRYSEVPSYEQEVHPYAYRRAPPVVVEEPAPAEIVVVRRPVIVVPLRMVVDEYPVYAAPRVYAALMCMRTPVRFGVTDGAIDVTSAAVGKVADIRGVGEATPLRRPARGCDLPKGAKRAARLGGRERRWRQSKW